MIDFFRQIISQVLGDLQFNFYHRWFDCIFLLSALFSIGILYLHYRSSQQSISLYDKNVQKVKPILLRKHHRTFRLIDLGLFLTNFPLCTCAVNKGMHLLELPLIDSFLLFLCCKKQNFVINKMGARFSFYFFQSQLSSDFRCSSVCPQIEFCCHFVKRNSKYETTDIDIKKQGFVIGDVSYN